MVPATEVTLNCRVTHPNLASLGMTEVELTARFIFGGCASIREEEIEAGLGDQCLVGRVQPGDSLPDAMVPDQLAQLGLNLHNCLLITNQFLVRVIKIWGSLTSPNTNLLCTKA